MGGFSLYREGMDRQSINTAIEILENAERPLIVFPEGSVTRTNDRLAALLDGVAFIARTAAKRRARGGESAREGEAPAEPGSALGSDRSSANSRRIQGANTPRSPERRIQGANAPRSPQARNRSSNSHKPNSGKIVIHPVGIKYLFGGDLEKTVRPVLSDIELRLSWQPHDDMPLIDRIGKIGRALLCLKEIEYFGKSQQGKLTERLAGLIDRLLGPLEEEWCGGRKSGPVVPRVKNLRMAILPDMVKGNVDAAERRRRWRQLAEIYLAQQVSCYPPDYLIERPTVTRILETVERFEEDLTDKARPHPPLTAVIECGEPIEVSPERDRKAATDPLMARLASELQAMLDRLSLESPVYQP
jgi:hypothetical protein